MIGGGRLFFWEAQGKLKSLRNLMIKFDDESLKSQVGICGCDVVQKLIGVLADERLLMVASWKGKMELNH